MTSGSITVLAEMPNLGASVRIFHKLNDVNSLLVDICSNNPFLEITRMTAFRGEKELDKTEKLLFGEQISVKYKYDSLGKVDTKAELEKVLGKMHDIDESLQKITIQNEEDLQDKEQRDPNKGFVATLDSKKLDVAGKPEVVYYGQGMAVPVIRVKLPGSKKATTIAPGDDEESQARFRRIAEADAKRIELDQGAGQAAILPLKHMKKEEINDETDGETEATDEEVGEEELLAMLENSREKETLVPFEEIPQLTI
ncbi:hypothetical protein TWF281_004097 [Arthrobotrys megalospora]